MDKLNNFFIPPDFRSGGACYGAGTGGSNIIGATTDCIRNATIFYIGQLLLVTAITAFIYIIIAGYQMMTAFGDEAKFAQAKKTLLYAMIGLLIALLAYTIVNFISSLLGAGSIAVP